MKHIPICLALLICWLIPSCGHLSSNDDAVDTSDGGYDDDGDDDGDDGDNDDNDDNKCDDRKTRCDGDVLSICEDGVWVEWDDCNGYSQICTLRNGEHKCADAPEDVSTPEDTETSDDTTTDSGDADHDSDNTDTAIHENKDTEKEMDSEVEADTEPIPPIEGEYARRCKVYCDNLSHCGLQTPSGAPYKPSITWFTDLRHCANDCTNKTNEEVDLVMTSCERAEFDLFLCEIETTSCEDLQLLIEADGDTSTLPCGDEMDAVLYACYLPGEKD